MTLNPMKRLMLTPKDADAPPDEVRSSEVVAAHLGVAHPGAPHPNPLPASGEREGPVEAAMGG